MKLVFMQKAGAQQDAWEQRFVRLRAAGKVASTLYVSFLNTPVVTRFFPHGKAHASAGHDKMLLHLAQIWHQ